MYNNDYELLYYMHQNCEKSFDMLSEKYERYIYYIINLFKKSYYFFGYEDTDLYNEGLILLYESVFTYRDDLNVKFSSYYLACLKRKYLYLIRTLASNKNRSHAYALSLDNTKNSEGLDLYNVIDNRELSIAEKVYNDYLVNDTINFLKKTLNKLEYNIISSYLWGYSYEEISLKFNVKNKKIDNTIQKYKRLILKKSC